MAKYIPGNEPDNIKERLNALFAKLDEWYPDKVVNNVERDLLLHRDVLQQKKASQQPELHKSGNLQDERNGLGSRLRVVCA